MDTDFRANPLPPPLAKGGAVEGYEGPEDPSGIELRESVTILLTRLTEGDVKAADALFPLLYDELRRIAHRQLRAERTGHTLSTTALVHEAYLRLVDQTRAHWSDRVHFLAVASRTMRRVLVDHARRVRAAKRGGGGSRAGTDGLGGARGGAESAGGGGGADGTGGGGSGGGDRARDAGRRGGADGSVATAVGAAAEYRARHVGLDAVEIAVEERAESLLALDEALERLAELAPRLARVVECRFFGGMTEEETAAALGLTDRTVRRDWVKAKGWLYGELSGAAE